MPKKLVAIVLGLILAPSLFADTVVFKNGTSVKANKTKVKGEQLEYIVGTTTYRVPLSDIDHVDKTESFGFALSVVGPESSTSAAPSDNWSRDSEKVSANRSAAPIRSGGINISNGDAVLKRILTDDRIDDRALSQIESEGNAAYSTAAYALAAKHDYPTDPERGRKYLQRALDFAPDNVALLSWYSSMLVDAGEYSEATTMAQRAVNADPDSADAYYALGSAYYATNKLPEAVRAWKRGLAIRPNDGWKEYVAKVERELTVEENFHEKDSSHFTVRFEGQRTGFGLAGEVLALLERQYAELSRELGVNPSANFTVVLYTQKEFFDVTQSPSWAGGLNDGKLRIPVKNVSAITGEFERVLKHELTHSFTHTITRGNSAGWIDEGLAQLLEPRPVAPSARYLAQQIKKERQLPLYKLEKSFIRLDEEQATTAYAEALVTVEYIRSTSGMGALTRILEYLGSGSSPEDALRQVTGMSYAQLEQDLSAALKLQTQSR